MRSRLARLAPEEIAGGVLLAVAILAAALQPSAIGRVFESPYATPAPENPARSLLTADATSAPTLQFLTAPSVISVDRDGRPIAVQPGRVLIFLDPGTAACVDAARSGLPVVCAPMLVTPPPSR